MKIKKGFVCRKVGGEHVVVPVGEMTKVFHGMINLNETGGFLWDYFADGGTKEGAVDALLAEYDVLKEDAVKDVDRFVSALEKNGFLE